jgi:hypothetical protein
MFAKQYLNFFETALLYIIAKCHKVYNINYNLLVNS